VKTLIRDTLCVGERTLTPQEVEIINSNTDYNDYEE